MSGSLNGMQAAVGCSPANAKEQIMGKETHGTRENKKQAVLTPKEKKAAKQSRKQEKSAIHVLIPPR